MRRFAWLLAVVACSGSERSQQAPSPIQPVTQASAPAAPPVVAPGLRLPDGVTPLHYDLTLDVDPDRDTFTGEVHVRIRLDRASDRVWIHAEQLDITDARYEGGALTALDVRGDQMRGFSFGRTLPAGEHELVFAYAGNTNGDQEGLFRQRTGDRWYLFSQGEAVFARRITPCFDEPRFKTPWRVTLVVPKTNVALANAPEEATTIDGDRKRITFAETPVMASYLLTIAVGPFDLVDAGTVGKHKIPLRVAVRAGAGAQIGVVASKLPAIVDTLEAYFDEPLPLKKLDLVGVPQFFGAMENPGLITFEQQMLVGKPSKQRLGYFTHIAAHELAHQWFGNSVTPAWWDDLWLSESFASWLGDKVARSLGAFGDGPLHTVLERRDALDADRGPAAIPLRRPIQSNEDPDEAFDAIAYQKGEAVIASFEALLGEDAFRTTLRTYVRAHRDRNATSDDLVAALAQTTRPEVGTAFAQYATHTGAPVVDLALHCNGTRGAVIIASARDQRHVPTCVRYAGGKQPVCALVADKTELPVGTACPAWVDGNPFAGYYAVHWQDRAVTRWLAKLEPAARVVVGDDLAAAFERGDLSAKDALDELRALLAGSDEYAHLGAVALAREIDEMIDDSTRPAWSTWLAARLPRVTNNPRPGEDATRALRALVPAHVAADEQRRARALLDKLLLADQVPDALLVASVAGKDEAPLFARILDRARATADRARRDHFLELLGSFPAPYAERTAALATDMAELPVEPIWSALAEYFDRPPTRVAAWQALRKHLDVFVKRAAHRGTDMIDAAGELCDKTSRDEVAQAFAPYLPRIVDGRGHLDRALAAIDACIARRGRVGDLAAAIATSH